MRECSVTSWFSVEGDGDPIVLLHGGLSDSTGWGMQTPALAGEHKVFLADRRGHGRTPDTDAPFSYDDMATETIEFLEQVVGGPAALVGWSDGGVVALYVSLRRPDLVPRQVLIGANFHYEGLVPGFDMGDDPDAEHVAVFKALYEAVAVNPSHWPVFFTKSMTMWREQPTLTVEDVARIPVPTLVLAGDDEAIRLEHTTAMYQALPEGQLAIVPGTSHLLTMEKPDLVNRLLLEFLAETGPPATMAPIRRVV
jgi:pimeloyl-ACP methyl ester carboxylesterase